MMINERKVVFKPAVHLHRFDGRYYMPNMQLGFFLYHPVELLVRRKEHYSVKSSFIHPFAYFKDIFIRNIACTVTITSAFVIKSSDS